MFITSILASFIGGAAVLHYKNVVNRDRRYKASVTIENLGELPNKNIADLAKSSLEKRSYIKIPLPTLSEVSFILVWFSIINVLSVIVLKAYAFSNDINYLWNKEPFCWVIVTTLVISLHQYLIYKKQIISAEKIRAFFTLVLFFYGSYIVWIWFDKEGGSLLFLQGESSFFTLITVTSVSLFVFSLHESISFTDQMSYWVPKWM